MPNWCIKHDIINPFIWAPRLVRHLAIMNASKAFAAMAGRDFVTPEDILECNTTCIAPPHFTGTDKEMEGVTEDAVIQQIIHSLDIPR